MSRAEKPERTHLSALNLLTLGCTVLSWLLVTRLGLDVLVVDRERFLDLVAKSSVVADAMIVSVE
jgi:hypothetical protein